MDEARVASLGMAHGEVVAAFDRSAHVLAGLYVLHIADTRGEARVGVPVSAFGQILRDGRVVGIEESNSELVVGASTDAKGTFIGSSSDASDETGEKSELHHTSK